MSESADLRAILDRIINGTHTDTDIAALHHVLIAGGERSILQVGKYNVNITQGQNIEIGDRIYQGPDLQTIRRAIEETQDKIAADHCDRALQDYFRALRTYCATFPYLALDELLGRVGKSLDEVYIPLRVRLLPAPGSSASLKSQPEPMTVAEMLSQLGSNVTHMLILGEPGAGKSTLLRRIAEHAWDAPATVGLDRPYIPMIVRLQPLALAEGASLGSRLLNALHRAGELVLQESPPEDFFTEWPRRMQAPWLLLLDGLDEVPADRRLALLRWLKDLLSATEAQGLPILLTSRPTGDVASELGESFAAYKVDPFKPTEREEFAHQWFGEQAMTFLQELKRMRTGALAGTPLLLTVAAAVFGRDGYLPERRVGLYDRFVSIWLSEAEKRRLKDELGQDLTDVARPGLEQLALAMTEQPAENSVTALSQVALDYLHQALGFPEVKAAANSTRFVEVLSRRSGVFIRRGEVCEWAHLTFCEYLAASALARTYKPNEKEAWEFVRYWREWGWSQVILFVLSIWSEEEQNVTKLVRRIWKSDQPSLRERIRYILDEFKSWCEGLFCHIRGLSMRFISAVAVGFLRLLNKLPVPRLVERYEETRGLARRLYLSIMFFLVLVLALALTIYKAMTSPSVEGGGGGGHGGHHNDVITAKRFLEAAMAEGIPVPTDLRERIRSPASTTAGKKTSVRHH